MGAQIVGLSGGLLVIKITGLLERRELAEAQKVAAQAIQKQGPIRILILTEDFKGWAKGGDWGDLSFGIENDPHIKKLAIVGDRRWEDDVLIFTAKGLRGFPIEYFGPAEVGKAWAWLSESGTNPPPKAK